MQVFGENPPEDVRLFVSVERFDYSKGIEEKLLAFKHYLQTHVERHGKDVLLQVAVKNREKVETYRAYQVKILFF